MAEKTSISQLKKYLGTPERPVTIPEFKEFWDSLTDKEKEEFQTTELPKEKD